MIMNVWHRRICAVHFACKGILQVEDGPELNASKRASAEAELKPVRQLFTIIDDGSGQASASYDVLRLNDIQRPL